MAKTSKRYAELLEKVQDKDPLNVSQAVKLLKQFDGTKFDQTVEIHMRLGVDAQQADQIIRGSLVLPNGIGRTQRIVVFAKGDLAKAAEEAGADEVGQEDLAKKIQDVFVNFLILMEMMYVMNFASSSVERAQPPSPMVHSATSKIQVTHIWKVQ